MREGDVKSGKTTKAPIPRIETPTFTEREWRFLLWAVAGLAWIPGSWTVEAKAVAAKLRAFLGES